MIGPISFLVGLGLLGGAGISKMLDSSRINAEKAYCSTHLHPYDERELKKAMGNSWYFNGFMREKISQELGDRYETNRLLRVWILRELGYRTPIEDEEKMEKYFYSGDYVSPLYSAALYIWKNNFNLRRQLVEEIQNTMKERLDKPFTDTYEDTKKRTLFLRRAQAIGELNTYKVYPYYNSREGFTNDKRTRGGEIYRLICDDGILPHELRYKELPYEEAQNMYDVQDIVKSFIELNSLARYILKRDGIDNCDSRNRPQYKIEPDKEAFERLFNCHTDEEETFGIHLKYDEDKLKLIKSEDELREFWSKNTYLQYQKEEKELCFEFAEKYDLSYFNLDKYDVAEFCCDGVGFRYTNIRRYNGTDIKQLKEFEEKLREKRISLLMSDHNFLQDYTYCAEYDCYHKNIVKGKNSFERSEPDNTIMFQAGYYSRAEEELKSWFGVSDELKEKERIEQEYQSHFDLKEK